METIRRDFRIEAVFDEVTDLAEHLGELMLDHPAADQEKSDALRLCAAEALNNIVEHAYREEKGHRIDVEVEVRHDAFRLRLTDTGLPMPGGMIPAGTNDFDAEAFDDLPEGGFGWLLIRAQMDHLEYRRQDARNILCLEMRLQD